MLNVSHEFIEVNGIKLHIAKQGNGKKLVILLHGWPEFWYTWRYQIPVLAEHFTVVAPDLRGFNLSDKPKGIENYKADVVATDVAELIKKSGFEKAYIVGHDWGGAVAWVFATMFPELTEKLVVCNCPHPKIMLQSFKSNPSQLIKSWYIFMHQIPLLPEIVYQFTLPLFFKQFVRGWMFNKQNFSDEDLNEFVKAYKQEGALTGSINYYRAMLQTKPNLQIFNKKIQSPTLLIWGEGDKALGKELSYGTEKYIDATYEVKYLSNCSHWTQNDCPNEVNEYLLDFFKYRMMKLFKNYIVPIFVGVVLFLLSSCCGFVKGGCNVSNGIYFINFDNFVKSDLDSVYLLKYEKNSNFNVLLDSVHLDIDSNAYTDRMYQTELLISSDSNYVLHNTNDYKIIIKDIAKTISISQIETKRESCRSCPGSIKETIEGIVSLKQDSVTINSSAEFINRIVITR